MALRYKIAAGVKMSRPEIMADTAAIGSLAAFLGMSLTDWEVIIHIIAGVVAIIAGVAAAVYHIIKIRRLSQLGE